MGSLATYLQCVKQARPASAGEPAGTRPWRLRLAPDAIGAFGAPCMPVRLTMPPSRIHGHEAGAMHVASTGFCATGSHLAAWGGRPQG